jgi:hypothetical protein
MQTYRGKELQLHIFLALALDGGEWSALLHHGCFTLGKDPPINTGGLVEPYSQFRCHAEEKNLFTLSGIGP